MKINIKSIKLTFAGSIFAVLLSVSFASICFADETGQQAQAGDQDNKGNGLSPLGIVWNWAADKTNLDGSTTTTSNGNGGVLQDADNLETRLGGEYVPGKGWVPSYAYTIIDGNYNTIKDTIAAGAKSVINWRLGKTPASSVIGAAAASGAVNLGESLADSDTGKKVNVASAVAIGAASAAVTEIAGQVIPGESKEVADAVAKSVIKTSVKTAADTILNRAAGKDPGKSFKDDLIGGVIDVVLTTAGMSGVEKDIGKAVIGGTIKDISTDGPKVEGSKGMGGFEIGGSFPGGGSLPSGSYTPSQGSGGPSDGGYTPGQGSFGDSGGGYSHEDHHGEGNFDDGDDGDDDAAYNAAVAECGCEGTIFVNENGDVTGVEIHPSGNPNPDGSGTDNGKGAKLEQMGIHLPGWGRNDGDSNNGSSISSSGSANHAGGGTDLFEPNYDSLSEIGTAPAPSGYSNDGMGDGNASETGAGPGNGGGIRSHEAIGSGYSGNTADETGFGGLDHLPMANGN